MAKRIELIIRLFFRDNGICHRQLQRWHIRRFISQEWYLANWKESFITRRLFGLDVDSSKRLDVGNPDYHMYEKIYRG